MKVMTFRINEDLEMVINRLSIIMGKSRSEIIREALIKYIELVEGKSYDLKPVKVAKHVLK